MKEKITAYIMEALNFFLRKILLIDIGLAVLVGLSFFIWGPFSYQALSERMIWTGIGIALIAGILVSSQTTGGRDFGTSGMFIRSAHAQTMIDWNIEVRQAIESRMGVFPSMFLVGAVLFGVGALIQMLFG
jgi:hypothetical protein